MEIKPLSISELNNYIGRLVSNDLLLYNLDIEGEVSNSKYHSSKTIYFTLKDSKSKLRCVLFQDKASDLDFKIEDGKTVIANGCISVYEREGSYQLTVNSIKEKGLGDLFEKLMILKGKLLEEGIFDNSNKQKIEEYPKTIGIITSDTGATIKDMIVNIRRRNEKVNIVVFPALMQGKGSVKSIIDSIEKVNKRNDIDTIILGRGGGSIEELWSFNEEEVIRAIYKSKIPIISAIGHETDNTLSDLVADKRASTPSVAAEISVKKLIETKNILEDLCENLYNKINRKIEINKHDFKNLTLKLSNYKLKNRVLERQDKVQTVFSKLESSFEKIYYDKVSKLEELNRRLQSCNPMNALERGFILIQDKSGKPITSCKSVDTGDTLKLKFRDGEITIKVEKVKA